MPASRSTKETAREFAIAVAQSMHGSHCRDIAVLDVAGLSPITDFFVIATATSPRQMQSVADDIAELGKQTGFTPLSTSGHGSESWILIDCIDVLCHLFSAEARAYYDLDSLWGDSRLIDWNTQTQPK